MGRLIMPLTNFVRQLSTTTTTTALTRSNRVLSVQSHVVSGYVGNKCATFPLQLLGFEVDAVNSVQFSNHTQYRHVGRAEILDDSKLEVLMRALAENGIDTEYTHLVNGYIGSASFLRKFGSVVKELRSKNPGMTFMCDPVLGDTLPGLYVPEELVPIYRDEILPLADVAIPNQFEAEKLCGRSINGLEDALSVVKEIAERGVGTVIISSLDILEDEDKLMALAAHKNSSTAVALTFPKFKTGFTGSGDLFTALTIAWLAKTGGDLGVTLTKATSTMQSVLGKTAAYFDARRRDGDKVPDVYRKELRLVQSKDEIEFPLNLPTLKLQKVDFN